MVSVMSVESAYLRSSEANRRALSCRAKFGITLSAIAIVAGGCTSDTPLAANEAAQGVRAVLSAQNHISQLPLSAVKASEESRYRVRELVGSRQVNAVFKYAASISTMNSACTDALVSHQAAELDSACTDITPRQLQTAQDGVKGIEDALQQQAQDNLKYKIWSMSGLLAVVGIVEFFEYRLYQRCADV